MKIGYGINLDKNIFLKINRARKFYIVLERFIDLLITIFITFYLTIAVKKFLVNYLNKNNTREIVANVITKPILQINDGLDSKVETVADKAFFIDNDNVVLENVIVKGNNNFFLEAHEGNINIKTGEILLLKRPSISISDN